MSKPIESTQTPQEERWNVLTHCLGIPLGFFIFYYLWQGVTEPEFLDYLSIALYAGSFIVLFSASTLYHWVKSSALKKKFRILDHISIYYLIAGTYSPVVLLLLEGSKGELIFTIVWSIAIGGTLLKLFFIGKFEKISLLLYLLMGWLIVIDLPYLWEVASFKTLLYLGIGGLLYTIGAFFYAQHKIRFNHVIWHIFVLLAAISHCLMVIDVVLLKNNQ